MDISLIITRTTIFIAVYSLVLGIPFLVAFGAQSWLKLYIGEMWWMTPLILLTVLATAGPFIYLYIQKRAEDKLFQDQKRYQATLRQAATGMGRIKDKDKLIGLIEQVVTESVGVEHCKVYKGDGHLRQIKELSLSVSHLYSELKQRAADNPEAGLDEVIAQMEELNAELIVPVVLDGKIIAHIVIGHKVSGELFSNDDISVFEILASQAALGFENAQYYDDIKTANERLFQAEKLAYIGTLASSIVHEIRNPLTSIKTYLSFVPTRYQESGFKEKFDRIIPGEVNRIERIVNQLLDLARRRPPDFQAININEILDSVLEMLENSFQLNNITINRIYKGALIVKGDPEQLKQVFINVFLNALQAMENGGELTVTAVHKDETVEIRVQDTGCGISDEQMAKLFEPFSTTKKDGVGLGLSVVKDIVESHGGTVDYQSEPGRGTQVYVTLVGVRSHT